MRTTLELDEELLERARRLSGVRTKKGVIEEALREYVRTRATEKLKEMIGTYEIDLTPEELRKMRGCE